MFTIRKEAIFFWLEYVFWLERADSLQVKRFHFESEKLQKKKPTPPKRHRENKKAKIYWLTWQS